MGEILTKTCFCPQSEPHTAKLCFSLVLSIFGEIHRYLLFLVQKVNISERSTEILRKFVLINMFEKCKSKWKFWICLTNVFDQTSKIWKILTKTCFSPQSEPHTAKLCLSVVLKHFWRNPQRSSLFSQKRGYVRNQHWNTQKVYFT